MFDLSSLPSKLTWAFSLCGYIYHAGTTPHTPVWNNVWRDAHHDINSGGSFVLWACLDCNTCIWLYKWFVHELHMFISHIMRTTFATYLQKCKRIANEFRKTRSPTTVLVIVIVYRRTTLVCDQALIGGKHHVCARTYHMVNLHIYSRVLFWNGCVWMYACACVWYVHTIKSLRKHRHAKTTEPLMRGHIQKVICSMDRYPQVSQVFGWKADHYNVDEHAQDASQQHLCPCIMR